MAVYQVLPLPGQQSIVLDTAGKHQDQQYVPGLGIVNGRLAAPDDGAVKNIKTGAGVGANVLFKNPA